MGKINRAKKISIANLKKTLYYLKRNGLKNTWYAARERLSEGQAAPYVYVAPSERELEEQRTCSLEGMRDGIYEGIVFSVVVPAYRTDPRQLQEMITSVIKQSYPYWELVVADATEDDTVKKVVEAGQKQAAEGTVQDEVQNAAARFCERPDHAVLAGTIRYVRLGRNGGISENTNQALRYVSGEYVGLLDHDDLLTADALYEMAERIRKARQSGQEPQILYSDEDKCNGDATEYYEPHFKENFNLDLILSNNYICHFMVMKRELIQKLGLRVEYEGAQDYDLVLRAVSELGILRSPEQEDLIAHIPRVLYHWRCHSASTAENPRSKSYAYMAGMRALQDFADRSGLHAKVCSMAHLGFYSLVYLDERQTDERAQVRNMLKERSDIGVIGGCLLRKGIVVGGGMDGEGNVLYRGLSYHASGYMHRAVLTQDTEAVDIRFLAVRQELRELFEETVGVPYQTANAEDNFAALWKLPPGADCKELSLRLCRAVREKGYRIVYLPEWQFYDATDDFSSEQL